MKRIEVILGLPNEGKTTKLLEMFVAGIKIESDKPDTEKKALVFISCENTTQYIIDVLVSRFNIPLDIAIKLPIYSISMFSEIEPILLDYLKDNDTVLFLDDPKLLLRTMPFKHHISNDILHTKLELLCTKYPVDDYKSLDIVYTKSIIRRYYE